MIFFKLETVDIIFWSIAIGFSINYAVSEILQSSYPCDRLSGSSSCLIFGLPIRIKTYVGPTDGMTYDTRYLILNLIFWILVVFLFLFLIKRHKNKNAKIDDQRNKI